MKTYCGIDLHKKYSYLTLVDDKGNILKQGKIETSKEAAEKFFASLEEKPACVIEPVSQWYWYSQVLEDIGCSVKLAHPMKVKAIASARIKTDKIDSSVLAHLLRSNLLPEDYLCPPNYRDFKELVRFRASLSHLRTRVKNKIHAILHKNGLKHQFTDLFGKAGRKWLRGLGLNKTFDTALQSYLFLIDSLSAEIKKCEEVIAKTVSNHESAKILTSIKGISFYSALTIVSEIGEIDRFPDAKRLMSYAGVVPSVYSSAGKTRTGRITKQGSKWLRWTMVEVAHRQARYRNTYFGRYYKKIQSKKGSGTAAVAAARKLLAVIYRMLKDGKPFDEQRLMSESGTRRKTIAF